MTHLLWKYYWEDDVDKFRHLLSPAGHSTQHGVRGSSLTPGGAGSPGYSTSPRAMTKSRKGPGLGTGSGSARNGQGGLGKSEVNSRDHAGLTVLLRAASSTAENAISFVEALLQHPAIDIYAQDPESGWNALHRALYAGNTSIARLLLEKERSLLTGHTASLHRVGQLIKTKDHEGKSPFDLYHSTIGERSLKDLVESKKADDDSDSDGADAFLDKGASTNTVNTAGEDLYAFGSNRNLSLGFGDEDDRQFPERVCLRRPDHLFQRFHREYLQSINEDGPASQDLSKIPTLVLNRPLLIQDVVLSKLHSAVVTTDPVSNLYVCGIGRGGRLGLGDENTRFTYTPVQGPLADRKVVQVALGQNHSMAIDDTGALWTWGNNAQFQLGYALPQPNKKDEDPISTVPRQVFGPLKKEVILGIAASSVHSVAHTGTSLFCWGKNLGQLALMDADSRSLEFQQSPRKVAASLFSSPIVMVTAIDKATTVLLQNHTVCVFTAYGYHIVKFPFATLDVVGNIKLATRYQPAWNQIHYITSGGETIAAVTKRGDLFTMHLDHKVETNGPATSTTNPSKIKSAVTQPQCIWYARHDGVRSVGVGEHGSVIISTESGAVWRRVKRAKAKDAGPWSSESKRSDFKFQRVPWISKVATVRASAFGTFAAIRKDSDIMKEQLVVDEQSLWQDVAPLNCLRDFRASEPRDSNDPVRKFWDNEALRDKLGSVAYEVLKSAELEDDLAHHLASWSCRNEPLDAAVCTSSSPDLKIPVHGWMLAARSPVLRNALAQFRKAGSFTHDGFSVSSFDSKAVVCFPGLDLVSLLNVVLYAYEDKVIPVWNFTGQIPSLAYRYRQIRQEVMKLATRLQMSGLEAAARMQVEAKRTMDRDFQLAIQDRRFFGDGDALIELDGAEVPVHSAFVCRRCPWFDGLFHGRSRGMWLEGRRTGPAERTKIDLNHAEPEAFEYVLQYLYGDCGTELFDAAVCDSFDDFLDLVMEVMSIANYLMLDRLSQICQQVMGRFANIRNIAHLLNAISPCSVTEFKDVGLEYICLQLETMLENHLLDELDEDLLLELDEVVRDNQAAQSPFVRSGRAELLLHESNPWLAEEIDHERQIRIKEMAFKAQREEEKKLASAAKIRYGSFDDASPLTPTSDKVRKGSRTDRNEQATPILRSKASHGDLMFEMDDDEASPPQSPSLRAQKTVVGTPDLAQGPVLGTSGKGKRIRIDLAASPSPSKSTTTMQTTVKPTLAVSGPSVASPTPAKSGAPWAATITPASKLDLRDIIQSETMSSQAALSADLTTRKPQDATPRPAHQKLSQKEKKRQKQAAQAAQAALLAAKANPPKNAWERSPSDKQQPSSPWKSVPIKAKPSTEAENPNPGLLAPATAPIPRRTASPDTRFSGQHPPTTTPPVVPSPSPNDRNAYPKPNSAPSSSSTLTAEPTAAATKQQPLIPHSKVYLPRETRAEPPLGLSMQDIMGQQTRDKESVREAVAKRSLQDIQQEQAFQEWWDAESKRMMEAEEERERRRKRQQQAAAAAAAAESYTNGSRRGERKGRGGRGGGGAGRGGGDGSRGGGGGGGGGGERGARNGGREREGERGKNGGGGERNRGGAGDGGGGFASGLKRGEGKARGRGGGGSAGGSASGTGSGNAAGATTTTTTTTTTGPVVNVTGGA